MKGSLNICVITQEFPPYTNWGGISVYYQELTKGLCKLGHKVTVITRSTYNSPKFEQPYDDLRVWRVGVPIRRKYIVGRTIDKILHAKDVHRTVKNLDTIEPFDIIEIPEVNIEGEMFIRDPYFCEKTVIQCHGSNAAGVIPRGMLSFFHRLDHLWSFHRELKILKNANRITVPSKAGREFLVRYGITSDKIEVIYHGVDITRFRPSQDPLPINPLEVGFVGKLHKMKGADFIWKVIEKIGPEAGIRFHFIGSIHPSEKDKNKNNLQRFSKFAVHYSSVSYNEMPKIYQSLHVLLQPSRFEQFGLVYAEGMACGLIVFAGIKGGGPEIIRNNDNGFLVDPDRDIDFVVHKLKEMVVNHASFDKIRIKAIKHITENFSIEASVKRKLEYYTKLLI